MGWLRRFWNAWGDEMTRRQYGCKRPIVLDGDCWQKTYMRDYGWVFIRTRKTPPLSAATETRIQGE